MIPKRITKFIKSLQIKKYRRQHQSFLVEGAKSVIELIYSDFEITTLLGTPVFLKENKNLLKDKSFEVFESSVEELSSLGTFKSNDSALATAKMKPENKVNIAEGEWAVGLDDIKDPGNLGTIIRIADWYGFSKVICSENSAEFYNPKVISATMGSFTRIDIFYTDLLSFIKNLNVPVYGAFLQGKDIHTFPLKESGGLIVMGNESAGIGQELAHIIHHKISIPQYGQAESLNVAIATAIICDNFRRKEKE
ncbi:RNA methyltransferase [soil metagenome]